MITIKVKQFDGKDLKKKASRLDGYELIEGKGDHFGIRNIETGERFTGVNRPTGFGLWCAIKKQAKQIGIIIIPIILIGMCAYLNGG